jgi:dynein intermediate chain
MVGTQNAHNLVSASTDGTVCAWTLDMLARPQETLELLHPAHNKTDEVSVTTLGFPEGETTTFWVGTEEGNLYSANRYDRAGAKAGLVQNEVYRGHSGPVTGMDFHPVAGAVDLSDLFLTCGVDWTVKLWRAGGAGGQSATKGATATAGGTSSSSSGAGVVHPIFSFEEADDYVYDVKWHPHHPALFGSVDGAGKFDLWNLNVDTEVRPVLLSFVLRDF